MSQMDSESGLGKKWLVNKMYIDYKRKEVKEVVDKIDIDFMRKEVEGLVDIDGLKIKAILLPNGFISVDTDELWSMGK